MKIGILGSGIVGRVLATAFLHEGYEVMIGSRNPLKEELQKWKSENKQGQTGNFSSAAAFADIIVLATKGDGTINAIDEAGKEHFSGKIIIDATNPIRNAPPVNGLISFFTGPDESFMEKLQNILPGAKLVKAFNSVGNAVMYKPDFRGIQPTMFICGNDMHAKSEVTKILQQFGWETEDMGTVEAARAIEPLCILWCIPGFLRNEWTHAFKLLKK